MFPALVPSRGHATNRSPARARLRGVASSRHRRGPGRLAPGGHLVRERRGRRGVRERPQLLRRLEHGPQRGRPDGLHGRVRCGRRRRRRVRPRSGHRRARAAARAGRLHQRGRAASAATAVRSRSPTASPRSGRPVRLRVELDRGGAVLDVQGGELFQSVQPDGCITDTRLRERGARTSASTGTGSLGSPARSRSARTGATCTPAPTRSPCSPATRRRAGSRRTRGSRAA